MVYKLLLAVMTPQSFPMKGNSPLLSVLCDPESFGNFRTISLQNIMFLSFFTIIQVKYFW